MNKLDTQYVELLQEILNDGIKKEDRTGTGTTSIFGKQIRHKMSEGFPILTTKKVAFKTMTTELLWFLKGRTDLRYLLENKCRIWTGDAYKVYVDNYNLENPAFSSPYPDFFSIDEFEKEIMSNDSFNTRFGDLGPIYGKQWRAWNTGEITTLGHNGLHTLIGEKVIDQIKTLIYDLRTNPDSRRLIVSAWNVNSLPLMTLPPCHYGFQMYTKELTYEERYDVWFSRNYETGMEYNYDIIPDFDNQYYEITPTRSISLMWNQRSVDTLLGLPFNIASYGLLLEIIAKMVNMIPDELIGNLGDTHLYSNHIEHAVTQIIREPFKLPTLSINSGNKNWHLLSVDEILDTLDKDITFKLNNYNSHPAIAAPLSN
jgi:thymidylate synthase